MKKYIMMVLFLVFAHQKSYSTNILPTAPAKPAATGTIFVTAVVPITCTVTTTPIAFPNYIYSSTSTTPTTANSTVTVTCTNLTPYNIEINAGNGASATVTSRSMTSVTGSHSLAYKLCQDANCTRNWGQTDGTDTVSGTGSGLPQNYTVYGVIAAGLNPAGGVYSDLVNVTINY